MAIADSSTRAARFVPLSVLKSPEVTLTIDELACIVYASVRAALDAHEAHEEPSSLWDAVVPAVEQAVGRA